MTTPITNHDLYQYIKHNFDEESICDLLNITSEDLVNRFQDFIDEKHEELAEEFGEEIRGSTGFWPDFEE